MMQDSESLGGPGECDVEFRCPAGAFDEYPLGVDHQHGAWFRILGPDNVKHTDEKSPAGKVDYHTTGACWRAIQVLESLGKAAGAAA